MKRAGQRDLSRRALIRALVGLPAFGLFGCASGGASSPTAPSATATTSTTTGTVAGTVQPTPACADADDPTASETEGPYFKPSSPERASLLQSGLTGTRIILAGQVLSTSCQPIAGALLDFWQADDGGNYDLVTFKLRGHQFSDATGAYRLETIVPGLYPGRTRHIHVKVQAPNKPILTTQMYFPGESRNSSDGLFMSGLLMNVQDDSGGKLGAFNFVLSV